MTARPPAGPGAAGSDASDAAAPPLQRRRLVGIAIVAVVAVAIIIGASTVFGGPRRETRTGIVVAVQATSLSAVQGFSIRTTDGQTVDFRVGTLENAATFPIGHLSEHKVSLAPVRVTYLIEDGVNLAVRVEDAP